jgi:hypothetical protein
MRSISLLFFLSLAACSTNKKIYFQLPNNINDSLKKGIKNLSIFKGKDQDLPFFAVVRSDVVVDLTICINKNLPMEVENLLKTSNRFLILEGRRIPMIYHFDLESTMFQDTLSDSIQFGGYWIRFDFKRNIIQEGIIF